MLRLNKMKKGFTILELLLVVGIIALLSVLILVSYSSARAKSRDARRMQDIHEISNALNLYNSSNGQFPAMAETITGEDDFSQELEANKAMSAVPADPLNTGTYQYTYTDNGTSGRFYELGFCLETNSVEGYDAGCYTVSP